MATGVYAIEIPDTTVQSSSGASYTIPANRYASVNAQVMDGGTFSINGTVVLSSLGVDTTWNAINANSSPSTEHDSGTIGTHEHMLTASENSFGTGKTNDGAVYGNSTAHAYARTSAAGRYRIKSGDTIVGATSCRYHVENYIVPGQS